MTNKLRCIVCGKEYETCKCSKDLNSYKVVTDTSNHYKIFLIVNDFVNNVISKNEAKEMLSKCDIKDYKDFLPNISNVIDRIFYTKPLQNKKLNKENKENIKDIELTDLSE